MSEKSIQNWARNITFGASAFYEPETIEELQSIVSRASKARPIGSRHSFNTIADTNADLISVRKLNRVLSLDRARMTVTVEGGITYGELAPALHAEGFALHNLASLPHISIAGACATATHGSGNRNGNLATAVTALKIATASGDLLSLSRADRDFYGAVVSLGALGPVVELSLEITSTASSGRSRGRMSPK
jgi:xylitol oxidase